MTNLIKTISYLSPQDQSRLFAVAYFIAWRNGTLNKARRPLFHHWRLLLVGAVQYLLNHEVAQ